MITSKALYIQLIDSIKKKIIHGEYQVGDRILSEREMSEIYGINRLTVRKAIKSLRDEGYLKAVQGKGTFVNKVPENHDKVELGNGDVSLSMSIRKGGMQTSRIVLSLKKIDTFGDLIGYFPSSPQVYELVRLSFINDKPYAVQECYFPCSVFKEPERFNFAEGSLYDYMEMQEHYPDKIISYLQIEDVPKKYTELLNITEGKKVFFFNYYGYDKDQNMIEYTLSYNIPEYTSFQFSTRRV